MTSDARAVLTTALAHTRRLTARQAAELLGTSPRQAGRLLSRLVDEGLAVRSRDAYWHPAADRRQSRHQDLVAVVYVALSHADPPPRWAHPPEGPVRPDALLETADGKAWALEADTGTERGDDWPAKLDAYARSPYRRILVVAPGTRRARRIAQMALGRPYRLAACTPADLTATWDALRDEPEPPTPAAAPDAPTASAARPTCWQVGGRPVAAEEAARLLAQGWLATVERRAGRDDVHLVPPGGRPRRLRVRPDGGGRTGAGTDSGGPSEAG
ncbi:MAG: replication-relaxation family protein [Actinomycetia bacterium]|nr:replication-relaxation family protein [Actinomycetes bacterium]